MFTRLFQWITGGRDRRRARLLAEPFPESWMPYVLRGAHHYRQLTAEDQAQLLRSVRIFVAEKSFLGCAGVEITDEVRVIVAAGACLLLLGLPDLDVFPRLREIIIYPHDFKETIEAIGPDGARYNIERIRAGEAWRRGPVVLAWNSVAHSIQGPRDGYNVILHEFAHVIDLQNGEADGVPPLSPPELRQRWKSVFFGEYREFVDQQRYGGMSFIDPYGATDPAEFFAVATEHFFEQPGEMKVTHPALYKLFVDFYRRDPLAWTTPSQSRWFRRGAR